MKKRSKEMKTAFSEEIRKECGIYGIQGLCADRDGNYTMAIEAIDMEEDETGEYADAFSGEELYAKACFAEALGARFSVLIRVGSAESSIIVREYAPCHESKTVKLEREESFTESAFVEWWKNLNYGKMRKAYLEEIREAVDEHYFDRLFKKNNSTWPESVDGFVTEKDASGNLRITAVIGNRISNSCKVKSYDPNRYFGRDYKEWIHLMKVALKLNVPLYLCTYSNRPGQERLMGLAMIDGVNEQGLIYHNKQKPVQNVMDSALEVKKRLSV